MKIWLFNTKKRYNSTARPATFDGAPAYEISLRQPTDYSNPTIDLNIILNKNYNYAYIDVLGSYYWIKNATILNNTQTRLHLQKDVLATYRESIRNTEGVILYATTGYNAQLPDSRVLTEGKSTAMITRPATDFFTGNGYYVLNVMSLKPNDGFTGTYFMTEGILERVIEYFLTLGDDYITNTTKYYGGMAQCLQYCKYIPLELPSQATLSNVVIANIDTEIKALSYNQKSAIKAIDCIFSKPTPYTDFRAITACEYQLYLPYIGIVSLAPDMVAGLKYGLSVTALIDTCTGDLTYHVTDGNGDVDDVEIAVYRANCSTNVSTAVNTTKPSLEREIAQMIAGGVKSIVSSIPDLSPFAIMGMKDTLTSNIDKTYNLYETLNMPITWQSAGSNGGNAEFTSAWPQYSRPALIVRKHNTTDPSAFTATQGRPVRKSGKIENYPGYVKMNGVQFESQGATLDEINTVTAFLNGGFYNE